MKMWKETRETKDGKQKGIEEYQTEEASAQRLSHDYYRAYRTCFDTSSFSSYEVVQDPVLV